MTTIAIIDKYPIIRLGLELFIRKHLNEISTLTFISLEYFTQFNFNDNPDLVILGNTTEVPNIQYELIVRLKRKNNQAKVIVYDENPDFIKVSRYFKSGVTGYLTKGSDLSELLRCVVDVHNGKTYVSNEILEVLLLEWSSNGNDPSSKKKKLLTQREYEIAIYLINGDSVSSISRKLQRKISTISTIKKTIFRKLDITQVTDLKKSLNKSF